jgi:Dolichyl-phosphate-mannose-protein mannosyltransferase
VSLLAQKKITLLIAMLGLTILAGILRFHDLGRWPYSGDETATLEEESVLFHGLSVSHDSQAYRLPHLIPVSYLVIHLSHAVFGLDEWGTRVLIASLGILSIVLIVWLLDGPMSRPAAIATALLVALMPQHVAHSQETRFYMVAAFFSFSCLLFGARTLWSRRSGWYAMLACCLALVAILTHTLLVILLPLVFVAICVGAYAEKRTIARDVWISFAIATLLAIVFFLAYVKPLVHGWNQGETWGYSPFHALVGSIAMIGWPVALLVGVGFVLMLRDRNAQNWYWLTCFLGWIGATLMLPLVVVYHDEYVFPLVLGGIVVAGYAISVIYDSLRLRSPAAALAWVALIALANLPALASHYVDGSRRDERGAAAYVREHWLPGDRVTGYAMGLFRFYSSGCCEPQIPLSRASVPELEHLASEKGRLWIVLENTRWGLDPPTQRWLFDCAVHKLSIGGRRFDEAEFKVEVYLSSRPLPAECGSSVRGRLNDRGTIFPPVAVTLPSSRRPIG